jgi:hypothetical protein
MRRVSEGLGAALRVAGTTRGPARRPSRCCPATPWRLSGSTMATPWLLRETRLTLAGITLFVVLAGSGCGAHSEPAKPIVQPPVAAADNRQSPGGAAPADISGSGAAPTDNPGPDATSQLMSMTLQMPYSQQPVPSGYLATAGADGGTYWYSPELPSSTSTVVETGQHFGVRVDLPSKAPAEGVHAELTCDGKPQPPFDIPSGNDFMVRDFRVVEPGDHVFRVSYQGRSFEVQVSALGGPLREPSSEPQIPNCTVTHSGDGAGIPCIDPYTGNTTDFYNYKLEHTHDPY